MIRMNAEEFEFGDELVLLSPYEQGCVDYKTGLNIDQCPYNILDLNKSIEWTEGWFEAFLDDGNVDGFLYRRI